LLTLVVILLIVVLMTQTVPEKKAHKEAMMKAIKEYVDEKAEELLTNYDFTLTFSHNTAQSLMYRAFDGCEGNPFTLTLPSHFRSHTLTSINDVRDRREKSEGDVRENRHPSRALSPLYIGI